MSRKISVCQGFLDTTAGIASEAQSEVQDSTQIHATIAQAQQPSGPWAAAGKRRCRPKRSRARLAWGGSSPGSHSARFSGTHLIYGIGAEIGRTLDFGKASQPEVGGLMERTWEVEGGGPRNRTAGNEKGKLLRSLAAVSS